MGLPNISIALVCALAFLTIHSTLAQDSPQDFVNAHNAARSAAGVTPIKWDETVAKYATDYANKHIEDCQLQHSTGPYGENLFKGFNTGDLPVADAVNAWIDEKKYYDPATKTCAPGQECGHYLIVVAPDALFLGCARVKCREDGWWFVICDYASGKV